MKLDTGVKKGDYATTINKNKHTNYLFGGSTGIPKTPTPTCYSKRVNHSKVEKNTKHNS
ncbi:MAG: hypothetical protein LBI79_02710 [Nitrososphaerota archaeon]|jgi:hypothetical protein|nr:hypothetical protein [Nitrososphaerota archaeon]